jgi:hypothetical protein
MKMKKKYHTIRTVPKYNKKISETEAKPILISIHDRQQSWVYTDTTMIKWFCGPKLHF